MNIVIEGNGIHRTKMIAGKIAWPDGAVTFGSKLPMTHNGYSAYPEIISVAALGDYQKHGPISAPEKVGDEYQMTKPAVDMTLEEAKADALARVRSTRKAKETGGVSVLGAPMRTDEGTQAKISGAIQLFENDPSLKWIDWETQPGNFTQIDKVTLIKFGVAIGRHVQACFSRSKELSEAVNACETVADIRALDLDAGWPS